MTEPIRPPRRHRLYFRIETVLFRHLLKRDPHERYVCAACLGEDHEHCEGANGRWSFCMCDDPDPVAHIHFHPHDPSSYWPHPHATAAPEHDDLELPTWDDLPDEIKGLDFSGTASQ